eukprot:7656616-Alexandrium_andersonii.AAC.1
MSASLVGSGDVYKRQLLLTFCGARELVLPATWMKRRQERMVTYRAPGAVSYTHLTLPTICSV